MQQCCKDLFDIYLIISNKGVDCIIINNQTKKIKTMQNLKSVTETKSTFTIKFEFDNKEELSRLKALSIILGNFNPLRKEMENEENVKEILNQFYKTGELQNVIREISKYL